MSLEDQQYLFIELKNWRYQSVATLFTLIESFDKLNLKSDQEFYNQLLQILKELVCFRKKQVNRQLTSKQEDENNELIDTIKLFQRKIQKLIKRNLPQTEGQNQQQNVLDNKTSETQSIEQLREGWFKKIRQLLKHKDNQIIIVNLQLENIIQNRESMIRQLESYIFYNTNYVKVYDFILTIIIKYLDNAKNGDNALKLLVNSLPYKKLITLGEDWIYQITDNTSIQAKFFKLQRNEPIQIADLIKKRYSHEKQQSMEIEDNITKKQIDYQA